MCVGIPPTPNIRRQQMIPYAKDWLSTTTVGEAARYCYPNITYDTALPQEWVNAMQQEAEFDPRGCVVWGYPKGTVMGIPLPITREAADTLADLGWDTNPVWEEVVLEAIGNV
jgi:hypothetical protein